MKPLDPRCLLVARSCTASSLRKATRTVTRLYDQALAASGVEGAQLSVLVALALMGEAPLKRLAEQLAVDRTTLTRTLGPLERKGWVESVVGSDQRVRLIRLTPPGRATLEKALPLWEQAQAHVTDALGRARWTDLVFTLDAVAALR